MFNYVETEQLVEKRLANSLTNSLAHSHTNRLANRYIDFRDCRQASGLLVSLLVRLAWLQGFFYASVPGKFCDNKVHRVASLFVSLFMTLVVSLVARVFARVLTTLDFFDTFGFIRCICPCQILWQTDSPAKFALHGIVSCSFLIFL